MHKNCSRREWLLRTAAAVPGAWLAAAALEPRRVRAGIAGGGCQMQNL